MPRRSLWTFALLLAAMAIRGNPTAGQPVATLTEDAPARLPAPVAAALADLSTVQGRVVSVNTGALAADVMDVGVTPDTTLRMLLDERSLGFGGAEIWSGRVDNAPLSAATFVRIGDTVQGSIRTLDAAYSIEPLPDTTLHLVRQLNLAALGPELPPRVPDLPDRPADLLPDAPLDDGGTFDVLVVYTPAARAAAGGTDAAVLARINLGIDETNTAYANSGVFPRLRLVGAQSVAYVESGDLGGDLDALTGTSDGQIDSVHTVRNAVGADLVQLVVGSAAGGACGVAWLMTSGNQAVFAPYAFSVTAYGCISPNYTFGHELGHNMGSNHAPDDPITASPLYAYSFGYKNPGNLFRTVMAYACSGGCPRILYFSNPSVSYAGQPTGTVAQHNNATSINDARSIIANWRSAVGPNTAPTISSMSNQTTNEDTPTPSLGFTVGDAESPASSLSVTASSSNAAVVANTPSALALAGSGATRTLVVTPQPNASGTTTITRTVSDGTLSTSSSFVLTVNPVDDPPLVVPTPGSTTTAHATPAQITAVVSDVDSAGNSLSLTAVSSNQALLPNANVSVGLTSTAANSRTYQVTMTPVAGQQGMATVTLYGSDGVFTSSAPFVLTVLPPSAPTVTPIAPRSTYEDTSSAPIAFTIGDLDTPIAGLVVSATSSNTAVVPNTGAALTLGGAGASRTLTITPLPDQNGATTITVSVSDGGLATSTTFGFTVLAINDPPAVQPVAAQTTDEDVAVAVPFTVSDIDSPLSAITVQATSSNTAVVAASGLVVTGSGAGRTVTMAPADDANGETTITLTASDGFLSAQATFVLTVQPVNDAPAMVGLPPLVSAVTDGQTSLTVTVADIDTAGTDLTLEAASSDATLLPEGGIAISPLPPLAGHRAFEVTLTPGEGETGSTTLVLTAGDGTLSSSASVVFNVTPTPMPPDPPTAVSASADGTTVSIAWTPALTGAAPTSSVIEIGTAAGTTTLPTQSVAWPATSMTLSLPEGTYYARVRAVNEVGTSAPSPEASITVVEADPIPGPPAAFSATSSGRTIRFTWTPSLVGAPAATYLIEAGSAPGLANLTTIDTGSPATAFDVVDVPPGTYWVRARAANAAGISAPSQDVSIVMNAASGCVGLPAAPVLLPPVISGNTVTLSWNPPEAGGAVTSYVLAAGSTAGSANLALFSTGGTGTSFAATAPDGLYFVRVAASNACGAGADSNEVRFNLGPQPPDAPLNLSFDVVPGGLVTLSWDTPATGEPVTGYMVEAGSGPGLANLAAIATGSTNSTFAATAPPGTYFVRVRALNSAGPGETSNEVTIVVP